MSINLDFKCQAILNNRYKKILSESMLLTDEDNVDFHFTAYDDGKYIPVFSVSIKFKTDDSNVAKIAYEINDDNILLIGYNIIPNPNTQYTICSSKKEAIQLDDKKYYIEPRIIVYSNSLKQVYIDLYEEIN